RQRRRLYVGNLPLNITADDLLRFMNQTLLSLNRLQPDEFGHPVTRPALETTVNRDRSFTFVQMATMDAANLMMALDGIPFNGANLKVRRPKEYVPPPEGEPVIHLDVSHLTGFVSNNVPDGPDKVFIGGLPPDLSEQLVMDLLTAFGPLRAFNLVKDPAAGPGVNKGFAFCMYANPQVTDVACSNLNNMEVGDRRIVVQRASVGSSTGGRRDPMRDAMGPYAGLYDAIAPLLRDHAEVDPATGALRPQRHPTDPVIVLYNLLSPEEMRDPAELKEAQEDVRLEAERLGPVVRIAWVSQHQPVPAAGAYGSPSAPAAATAHSLASTSTGHHVRVYIEYASMDAAQQALASLAGRTFNHRVVLGA
ncbi:RNA-binding domain-containing protein, partial [Caulochytrium protostelioides]